MKNIFLVVLVAILSLAPQCGMAQRLVPAGKGYSSTSVNAAIFRKNSVVSQKGWQFVAYYDADGYVTIGKRKIGDAQFVVTRSKFKGKVSDGHNIISIGIDGKGYLHVSFDHHNNKLHYCKGVAPYSAELGEEISMLGVDEEKVTYPEFYSLKGGDLLFVYRSGQSGQGNLVMNRYDVKTSKWQRVQDVLIDGEGQRNAYWQMQVDGKGVIHVSWVWRETWLVETNHDLCYACSKDGGKTWQKSTGEAYTLPITATNAEYIARIPQKSELINQTSIAADDKSRPYIASYWRGENDSAPQYKIVYQKDGKWTVQNVSSRQESFSLAGGGTKMIPMSRPQLAVTNKGNNVKVHYLYRDAETGSKVTVATNDDLLGNVKGAVSEWTVEYPEDIVVDAWEPSYDTNLWAARHNLHVFVQRVKQGDGEKVVTAEPETVYVLEYR